jgi:hypothetical protein
MSASARIKACAAALAVVLCMPSAAHADISTMQMMEWCKPVVNATPLPDGNTRSVHTYESGTCSGAFLVLHALSHKAMLVGVCPPDGVGIVQMVRIFDAYARQHPEIQHQSFELTALAAFKPVYPCK